jgi:twitching motility protein PilJ
MIEFRGESSTQPGSSFKYAVLIVLLVFSIILIGTIFVVLERQNRINNKYIQLTIEQQLLSRSVVTQAFEASRGIALAFDKLKETRDRFDAILNIQRGNDSHQQDSLPEPSSALVPYVRDLDGKWRQVRSRVDVILAGREAVLSVSNFVPLLEGLIPRLVELSDQLSTALANSSVSPKQVYMVTRQLLLGQRMESNLNRMLTGGTGAASAADDFERDVTRFGTVLRGMATGDPRIGIEAVSAPGASAKVSELTSLFSSIEKQAGLIRGGC